MFGNCGLECYTEEHREEAMETLRTELAGFSHDGLVTLGEALRQKMPVKGSWGGCPLSYRRGEAGTSRRDSLGRARNPFTILWDNGWIVEEEVLSCVEAELSRREDGREDGQEVANAGR